MSKRIENYFARLSDLGLDIRKAREENHQLLTERLYRIRHGHSTEDLEETNLIRAALPTFQDPDAYEAYLEALEQQAANEQDATAARSHELERQLETERREIERLKKQLKSARSQSSAEDARLRRERDLERQKLKKLEQDLAKAKKREEKARREIEVVQAAPKEEAQDRRSGWTDILAGVLGGVAQAYLEKAAQAPPSIAGRWHGDDGFIYDIYQKGNQIAVQGRNVIGAVLMEAQGVLHSSRAELQFQGSTGFGQAVLEINGSRSMQVQFSNYATGISGLIHLRR